MRRVLVIRLDGAGDVLLAGPAVRAVARDAQVSMLCGPAGVEAAALLPGVHGVLEWSAPWIVSPAPPLQAADVADLVERVRSRAFAEAIVLTSFHQSPLPTALLLRLAGVPRITGASVDYAGALLSVRLVPGEDLPEDLPEPERAVRIAAAAGYPLPPVTAVTWPSPRLSVPLRPAAPQAQNRSEVTGPWWCCTPGPRSRRDAGPLGTSPGSPGCSTRRGIGSW